MYKIKEKFDLLKNFENYTQYSTSEIKKYEIINGIDKTYSSIRMSKPPSNFTKDMLYKILSSKYGSIRDNYSIIYDDRYKLATSYDKKNDKMIINISYYDVDDIYGNKPDPRALMACLVYDHVLKQMYNKSVNIHQELAGPIISFISTLILSIFGKQYGLIGAFSDRIPLLKYLTGCYVLASYFNLQNMTLFETAKQYANVDFRQNVEELKKYDFANIMEFIKVISESKVMSGFNVHEFTHKIYRFLGIHFLTAMEDFGRFMALMTVADISGNSFVPFSLKKYNQKEYQKIIKTCSKLFI